LKCRLLSDIKHKLMQLMIRITLSWYFPILLKDSAQRGKSHSLFASVAAFSFFEIILILVEDFVNEFHFTFVSSIYFDFKPSPSQAK